MEIIHLAGPGPAGTLLRGELPDQAAVDEVMAKLCAVRIELILANTRSLLMSEFSKELKGVFEPEMVQLN